jgi:hypothetical protein
MSTSAQIKANRANAQASTGPKTAAGKLASSRNNLRHGLCAKQLVLPGENPADYDALRLELHVDYAPGNTAEATLVDQIAEHTWRLQRVRRAETAMFDKLMRNMDTDLAIARAISDPEGDLERIRRYEVTIERSYHRAIDQLRKLQKQRAAAEKEQREAAASRRWLNAKAAAEEGIGFVSRHGSPAAAAESHTGFVSQQAALPALAAAGLTSESEPAAAA